MVQRHACVKTLNFRLCPLAEELWLEHSRLCRVVRREGGREESAIVVRSKKGALKSGGELGGSVLVGQRGVSEEKIPF